MAYYTQLMASVKTRPNDTINLKNSDFGSYQHKCIFSFSGYGSFPFWEDFFELGQFSKLAMKKLIIICILLSISKMMHAQIVGEIFSTGEFTTKEFWFAQAFTEKSQMSFFSFNRFRIDYQDSQLNEFLNYSAISYDLGKGFGISSGGFTTNQGFSPIVAINYLFMNKNWMVNFFPALEIRKSPNADIFVFIQFRPRINENLRLFSQIIAINNFRLSRHNFTDQNLRIGLETRGFQFGLGLEMRQVTNDQNPGLETDFSNNLGLFLRKEF